jgi:hypothetical protein
VSYERLEKKLADNFTSDMRLRGALNGIEAALEERDFARRIALAALDVVKKFDAPERPCAELIALHDLAALEAAAAGGVG